MQALITFVRARAEDLLCAHFVMQRPWLGVCEPQAVETRASFAAAKFVLTCLFSYVVVQYNTPNALPQDPGVMTMTMTTRADATQAERTTEVVPID